jgi:hypothetical protein
MNRLSALQQEMSALPQGEKREAERRAKIAVLELSPAADETAIGYAEAQGAPQDYAARVFESKLRDFLENKKGMTAPETAAHMTDRLIGVRFASTFPSPS